jgi:flagellin-like hook-associated protein FlgL
MAGDGNDLIVGGNGEGDDVYIGGAGSDTIRYSSAKAGITVNLATGFAGTTGGGNAANIGTDHLSEIENLIGSHYSDYLTGDANSNEIAGNGGDDLIDGGAGEDTAVFSGARASYKVKVIEGGFLVERGGESVQVKNIEYLRFSDGTYRVGGGTSQSGAGPMEQSHGIAGINITTQAGASEAIKTVDIALSYVNQQRSALGAMMNVLEARGNVLTAEKTNTQAARMQIMDTNYAFETAALAKQMVLLNAGQAMLAMANQSGKDVLSLLR